MVLIDRMLNARLAAPLMPAVALVNRALAQILLWLVRLYQLTLSPFIGNQCRFHPTCSHYAMQAVQQHGPWRGSWLAVTRLGRCHPFTAGGVDPVPDQHQNPEPLVPHAVSATACPQPQVYNRRSKEAL